MADLVVHSAPEHTAALIFKGGFVKGRGGHDHAGDGIYFSYVPPEDYSLLTDGRADECSAVAESRRHALRKSPKVVTLVCVYDGRWVLDLTLPENVGHYRNYADCFRRRLRTVGLYFAPDEKNYSSMQHPTLSSFAEHVAEAAGVPVEAIRAVFSDLEALGHAPTHPNGPVPRRTAEFCLRDGNVQILGRLEAAKRDWVRRIGPTKYYDYSQACARAVELLRNLTDEEFVALVTRVMCLRSADAAGRHIKRVDIVCSSEFVQRYDGYSQVLQLITEQCCNRIGLEARVIYLDGYSPEELRGWSREIRQPPTATIVMSDDHATVAGAPRTVQDAGLPCLLLSLDVKHVDRHLCGRSNLLIGQLEKQSLADKKTRDRMEKLIRGFIDAVSKGATTAKVEKALSVRRDDIAARLTREGGHFRPNQLTNDLPVIAEAISTEQARRNGEERLRSANVQMDLFANQTGQAKTRELNTFEIDLKKLAEQYPRLVVLRADLDANGYLVPAGTVDEYTYLLISTRISFTRQRFTLAHELGHYVYRTTGVTAPHEEAWCDEHAAELLMPRASIEKFVQEARDWKDWESGPAMFAVSPEVFWRRMWKSLSIARLSIARNGVASAAGPGWIFGELKKFLGQPNWREAYDGFLPDGLEQLSSGLDNGGAHCFVVQLRRI